MSTERTIYAVVYGNYDPPEVAALYADELSAVEDAEARNAAAQTGMWEVQPMTLHERSGRTDG